MTDVRLVQKANMTFGVLLSTKGSRPDAFDENQIPRTSGRIFFCSCLFGEMSQIADWHDEAASLRKVVSCRSLCRLVWHFCDWRWCECFLGPVEFLKWHCKTLIIIMLRTRPSKAIVVTEQITVALLCMVLGLDKDLGDCCWNRDTTKAEAIINRFLGQLLAPHGADENCLADCGSAMNIDPDTKIGRFLSECDFPFFHTKVVWWPQMLGIF